jgi:hypothetical protein
MKNSKIFIALAAATSISQFSALAAPVVVNDFQTISGPITVDAWYKAEMAASGNADIQNLTGAGGVLENSQPLPTGAAHLTTSPSNSDKAVVGTYNNFGLASSVLTDIDLSYSYYKVAGGTAAAAPAIKLEIQALGGSGDNYGQLIYEPYWNGGNPAVDSWTSVAIDENTGSVSDSTGGWWWSGGFEISNSAGGPPLRSLAEWAAAFGSDADFANAYVTGLLVGIGTYNPGEDSYFDAVSITTSTIDKTYDFQAASVPDAGATLGLFALSLAGISALRRKS